MNQNYELSLKILVLGAPKIGKSAIIYRYILDKFVKGYSPTMGIDIKNICLHHTPHNDGIVSFYPPSINEGETNRKEDPKSPNPSPTIFNRLSSIGSPQTPGSYFTGFFNSEANTPDDKQRTKSPEQALRKSPTKSRSKSPEQKVTLPSLSFQKNQIMKQSQMINASNQSFKSLNHTLYVEFWEIPLAELYGNNIEYIASYTNGIIYVANIIQRETLKIIDDWMAQLAYRCKGTPSILLLHQQDRVQLSASTISPTDQRYPIFNDARFNISVSNHISNSSNNQNLVADNHANQKLHGVISDTIDEYCKKAKIRSWNYTTAKYGLSVRDSLNKFFKVILKSQYHTKGLNINDGLDNKMPPLIKQDMFAIDDTIFIQN